MRIIKNKERIRNENAELKRRINQLEEKIESLTRVVQEISEDNEKSEEGVAL